MADLKIGECLKWCTTDSPDAYGSLHISCHQIQMKRAPSDFLYGQSKQFSAGPQKAKQ